MPSDGEQILSRCVDYYLRDEETFNGLALSRLAEFPDLVPVIKQLVDERKIDVLTDRTSINPHIKRLGVPAVPAQLESIAAAASAHHVCLYPHPNVLALRVGPEAYQSKPYTRELALGAPQLDFRFFDLAILERYRNDPRYRYSCDDVHGDICISDEFYKSNRIAEHNQVLLSTFGFAYNEKLERSVTTFVWYLSQLSPEHQQLWRAEQLSEPHKINPDFFRSQILGEWPERIPIFTAFWMELQTINEMSAAMGKPPFFRNTTQRPARFAFLVRPTLSEYNDFVLVLDNLLSDNINKEFFQSDVALTEEISRGGNKFEVRQKGTLQLLDAWLKAKFRPSEGSVQDEMMAAFRRVRKLRQSPAHKAQGNTFDQKYFRDQRELMLASYTAVRTLRLILANHPATRDVRVMDLLYQGKIWSF